LWAEGPAVLSAQGNALRAGEVIRGLLRPNGPRVRYGERLARWADECVERAIGPQGVALGWVN
jgi:hypothetical protein